MILQRTLFDSPAALGIAPQTCPFVPSSPTSRAAAKRIGPAVESIRQRVLDFIAGRGFEGATDQEVAGALGMLSDTSRARRVELRDRGQIVDSGRRRPSPSGRPATVWIANPFPGK